MPKSAALRQQLSGRIRGRFPPEWTRFTQLWLAFNAVYGGEQDARERRKIKAAIRKSISESRARGILARTDVPTSQIFSVPPGDMRRGRFDPEFRRASRQQARLYRTSKRALDRLVAVAGVLYQVRCNFLHGQKDPYDDRDQMLVRQSVIILEVLVPEVE